MKQLITLLSFFLLSLTALGQSLTINAHVFYPDGLPVEGVEVVGVDSLNGVSIIVITDADGLASLTFDVSQNNAGDSYLVFLIDCNGDIQAQSYTYMGGDEQVDMTFVYCDGGIDSTNCFVDIFAAPPSGQGTLLTAFGQGVSPLTYSWSTGETTETILVFDQGTYCVTVSDAANCIASQCITVDTNPLDSICQAFIYPETDPAGNIVLFGGGFGLPPFDFLWSTGETTESIPVDPNVATYCLTITDANGCEASTCIDITDMQFCEVWLNCDPPGTLTAMPFGFPPFVYQWNTGDTTETIPTQPGNEYCVTVTDATGCVASSCMFVDTTNIIDTFCFGWINVLPGDSTNYILTAEGFGIPPYQYNWSTGEASQTIMVDDDGTYCVTITDVTGCVSDACIVVDSTTIPPCEVSIWVEYSPMGIMLWAESWNSNPASYLWSTGETEPFIIVTDSAEYCVTITDIWGCTATACVNPFINTQCDLWLTCDPPGTLTANPYGLPPFTYEWSNGSTEMMIQTVQGETYCVTVTDATGCMASGCMTIDSFPFPPDSCWVEIINAGFIGLDVLFAQPFGIPPFQFSWSDGSSGSEVYPDGPGTYCVTMTDAAGCVPAACYDFTGNSQCYTCIEVEYNYPDSFAILNVGCGMPNNAGTHVWSTGDVGQTIIVTNSGDYCVTSSWATGTDSCVATACVYVELDIPDSTLSYSIGGSIIPTTFGAPITSGSVLLIKEQADGTLEVIDTSDILMDPNFGLSGYFFDANPAGTYYVQAIPDMSDPNNQSLIPTYYVDAPLWTEATAITLPYFGYQDFAIFMLSDQPIAPGPGLITGLVTDGSGFEFDPNRNANPFPGVSVFLTTPTAQVLQHMYTDDAGEFFFSSLEWGSYRLYVDHLNTEPFFVEVDLTPGAPSSGDILIEFNGVDFTTEVKEISQSPEVSMYPNPATDRLILTLEGNSGIQALDILSLDGHAVYQRTLDAGDQTLTVDVSQWPAGIYVVQLRNETNLYFDKFMVRR